MGVVQAQPWSTISNGRVTEIGQKIVFVSCLMIQDSLMSLLSNDLQQYKAHKIILSKSSEFFRQVLEAFPPVSSNILFLKGIDGNVLKCMLKFIYEGTVSVPEESL